MSLNVGELDPPDAAQVASVSEPTLTILLEARIHKQSFSLGAAGPVDRDRAGGGRDLGREAPRPDQPRRRRRCSARCRRAGNAASRGRERPIRSRRSSSSPPAASCVRDPRRGRGDAVRRERRAARADRAPPARAAPFRSADPKGAAHEPPIRRSATRSCDSPPRPRSRSPASWRRSSPVPCSGAACPSSRRGIPRWPR